MKKIKLLTSLASIASLTAITLPLAGCSCTNTNDPTVYTVESIEVYSSATKTEFKVGDTFNSKGLILLCKEEDGSRWQQDRDFTTDFDNVTFTEAYVGQQTVTVTYKNKTCTYKINVEVAGIELVFKPYIEGAYAMLDDQGNPKEIDVKKDQIYIAKVAYDPTTVPFSSGDFIVSPIPYIFPIYSEEDGDYSCKTSISTSLTITPLGKMSETAKNCGYYIQGLESTTAQTISITFKAIKDYPNIKMFVFTGL